MILSIFILACIFVLFFIVVGYLIYLKKNNRSLDEDDCSISRKDDLLRRIKWMKQKERKASLKKKRELEMLDRKASKKNSRQ